MANWGPKVTQLAPLTSLGLKGVAVTMPDPIRHPWRRWAHPGATHRMRNTHEDQGFSSRKQPVLLQSPITDHLVLQQPSHMATPLYKYKYLVRRFFGTMPPTKQGFSHVST